MSKRDWAGALKTARMKLGESQEHFARRFMVTTNTISRWETGTYQISLEAIEWLMEYALNQEVRVCPRCAGKGVVNETVGEMGSATLPPPPRPKPAAVPDVPKTQENSND